MYISADLSPQMCLISMTVVSFMIVVASANSQCNPVPIMQEIPGTARANYTLSQRYDIEFGDGGGSDECGRTVFKCPNSSSLILKSFEINTKQMIKFEEFKVFYMGVDVISFGGWNIPRSYGANDYVYKYTPNTLIAGNGTIGAEVNVVISSLTKIPPQETSVEVMFHCVKIDPLLIASPWVPDESATFTKLFLMYVIPNVIFFLLFMMSIIHRCNPYVMAKLKSWGGFTAMDEEEIRNHAGGGTWHDHVDEIITDLKSRGVHEKRADKEEEEMKGMSYSESGSMSNSTSASGGASTSASGSGSGSGSGSYRNNAARNSNTMTNSEANQSITSVESEEDSDEEDSEDVDSEDL
eukprot:Tbor_TRINITY_DN5845_c0_g2::TRINITY_DN5845_c0_g2_i3::g.6523::m.6523